MISIIVIMIIRVRTTIKLELEADEEVPGNEFRQLGKEDVACFDNLSDLG